MKVDGRAEDPEGRNRGEVEQIVANRARRRRWWREGILENPTETLWCAAGHTYSMELAGEANKQKSQRSFEDIVPEEYR